MNGVNGVNVFALPAARTTPAGSGDSLAGRDCGPLCGPGDGLAGLRGAVKAGSLSLLSLLGVLWDTCCPAPKSGTAPWVVDRHSPTPPWPWPVVRKYRFVRNRKCRCVISPVWVYPEAGRELGFEGKGQWRCGLPGHIPDA